MNFLSWLTWYKEPEYRDIKEYSATMKCGHRSVNSDDISQVGIPLRLQLDRMIENKTCECIR